MSQPDQSGFTTVELLVSIFIASAFILTGYRLFAVVMEDGNNARMRSRASNVAYENIRKYSHKVGDVCSPPTPTSESPSPPADMPNTTISISYSCPYGNNSSTTRINAVVTYGDKSVRESLDVSKQ